MTELNRPAPPDPPATTPHAYSPRSPDSETIPPDTRTDFLLRRWYEGDRRSFGILMERDMGWIRNYVRARLRMDLRAKEDSQDLVQQVVIEILKYGPRFLLESRSHFRGFVAAIAVNVIRGRVRWYTTLRRDMHKECSLPEGEFLHLDSAANPGPPTILARREKRELVRFALELLDPRDRDVILLHHFERKSFHDVAEELEISTSAAEKRFQRAIPRLAHLIRQLESGQIEKVLHSTEWTESDSPLDGSGERTRR